MHTNTHPEPEERERSALKPSDASGTVPEPRTLREALAQAKEEDRLSIRQLGTKLAYSPSVVSQYLNEGKYPGDNEAVERRIREFLRTRATRLKIRSSTIVSDVIEEIHGAFRLIRRTNDVGVIYGPSGIGKTTAIKLYAADNPMCIAVTVYEWCKGPRGLERLVFEAIENGSWDKNTSRSQFIADRLRGSDRLLIIDNAHKATAAAANWIADLWDETDIPIALVGNERMLRPFQADEQLFSRANYKLEVLPKDHMKVVRHLVGQIAPAMVGKVEGLLEQVAADRGSYRAVAKELSLAVRLGDIMAAEPAELVRRAHKRLLRPSPLT